MKDEFLCKIKWKHIFLLLFCFLCMMAIMRYTALQVKVISGGTSVLDLSLGNSVEYIRQTLIGLGYDGRMYYLNHFLVVDCIYVMVYAMFYFCSIIFLLHKNDIRRKRVYIFSVLPIAGMFFDWLENLSLRFLLVNGTTESVAWCMLFRVSNIVKFLFVYLSLLLVALGILYYFLRKVKVLDILISAWDCEKEYIDLSDRNNASINISFASNDICVVAVPSFSGRVQQFIIPKLRKIQGKGIKAVLVTAYGNRAFDDTLLELKDMMEGCGFICSCAIAAVTRHSVLPRYGEGRPDSADIEELKQFSRKCKEIMEKSSLTVTVPGNRPYRKYVLIPINSKGNKQCINCGLCYRSCPVSAIPCDNYRVCDRSKCISCL